MKIEGLTEETIKKAKAIYWDRDIAWDTRMKELMTLFNKSERTVRRWCSKLGFVENTFKSLPDQYKDAQKRVFDKTKKYYLFTWAQNNTPVHTRFFDNLKAYAAELDASIHVIPGRYKNPTSVFDDSGDAWSNAVVPYLDATRNIINNNITLFGDIKIQPTAVNPMSDLQGLCYVTSCVFGSPKVQLHSIPVLPGTQPRIMMTTGACTMKNYTDSKAGKKGAFHHVYGAVIIEVKDSETVFFRQITAKDNGDFNDLYYNASDGMITRNNSIEAIVYGDLHSGEHDQKVLDVTREKILKKLKPTHIILHDVFSGTSINPHESSDPFLQYGKQFTHCDNLQTEIDTMLDVIGEFENYDNVVIVRSNHDDFLDRWLTNEDWKKQPTMKNSRLYMKLSDILLKQHENYPYMPKGVIPTLVNEAYPKFITLGINDSYVVRDFELGMHGHLGSNGSKGGPESFRKLNKKMISAHTHSAFRKDGLVICGTSTILQLNYIKGPSSWTQGHAIIDNYGKAQNIIFFNGEFTTFE